MSKEPTITFNLYMFFFVNKCKIHIEAIYHQIYNQIDRDVFERDFYGVPANIIEYDTFVSFLFVMTLNSII